MDSFLDDNNNVPGEKIYSLRPRSATKFSEGQEEGAWKPRSRSKKRKQKSAPLSKYKRKTANARERSRMREINEAFEALRRAVPHLNSGGDNAGEKVSKIMTLRLAIKYITALSNALDSKDQVDFPADFRLDFPGDSCSTASSASDWILQPCTMVDHPSTSLTVDTTDAFAHFFAKTAPDRPPPLALTPPDEPGPRPRSRPQQNPNFAQDFFPFNGLPSPVDFCDLFVT